MLIYHAESNDTLVVDFSNSRKRSVFSLRQAGAEALLKVDGDAILGGDLFAQLPENPSSGAYTVSSQLRL